MRALNRLFVVLACLVVLPASAYAQAVHVDNFHSQMLFANLKCLAEATRISLAQSFSRNGVIV